MSRSSSPQASQPGIQGALSPVVVATNSGPHVGIVLYEKDCGCDTDRRGLVRTRNEVINQRGETVLVYTPLRIMASRAMRDGDPPRSGSNQE